MKVSLAEMTRQEKIELWEALWADICQAPDEVESPGWHAQELEETERRVASGEESFIDWETAKKQIIEKHK